MNGLPAVNFRLDNKVALLTGSGRGIGLAIARGFAGVGCAVAIQDIDLDIAKAEAKKINDEGGKAIALGGDIHDLSLPKKLIDETIQQLGGLHILINNAAVQSKVHWLTQTIEQLESEFRADLLSPIAFCQQIAPIFKEQKFGRIINFGSIQQRWGNPEMLAYTLSKHAMTLLTKTLARDLSKHGITVNCIAPGWIDTYRNRGDFKDADEKIEKGKRLPLGRIGEPSDFPGTALQLCSPAGEYITGQTIFVDGGLSA